MDQGDSDDENEDDEDGDHNDENMCRIELDTFNFKKIKLPMKDKNKKFNNPLLWWKQNEHKFPILAQMARKYLSIPATSAPSERIWSRASNVLTIKRAKLDDAIASDIMFIKENEKILFNHYENLTGDKVANLILPTISEGNCSDKHNGEMNDGHENWQLGL